MISFLSLTNPTFSQFDEKFLDKKGDTLLLCVTILGFIRMVGSKKRRSHLESRGDHIRGGQIQQKSLGGTGRCSV